MSHKDQLNYTTEPSNELLGSICWELFGRVEKLEALTTSEPEEIEDNVEIAMKAMEEADKAVDELHENIFMNCALEYVKHYLKFDALSDKWPEQKVRDHFNDSYIKHRNMIEAYESLS